MRKPCTECEGMIRDYPARVYPGRAAWLETGRSQASLVIEDVGTVATATATARGRAVRRLDELLTEMYEDRQSARAARQRAVAATAGVVIEALFRAAFVYHRMQPNPPPNDRARFASELRTLGLTEMPSEADLRAAWKRTARSTHPDAGGSAAAFSHARAAAEKLATHLGVKL